MKEKKRLSKFKKLINGIVANTSQFISFVYNCILQLWTKVSSQKKTILRSMGFSATLILIGYFVNNSSLFTGEAAFKMYMFEKLSKCFDNNNDSVPNDIVYFNISSI